MESRASTLSLVGGALALDFANTASGRGTAEPTEHLQQAAHVVAWARHAGAIDAAAAEQSLSAIEADGETADKLLRHARELREAIYTTGSAIAGGRQPADADLKIVKGFAARTLAQATLRPRSDGVFGFDFAEAQPEAALLGPIAWSLVDLLGKGHLERLKRCDECGFLFFDHSKNNSRRWCDMATCGNRTKLRRHRRRK